MAREAEVAKKAAEEAAAQAETVGLSTSAVAVAGPSEVAAPEPGPSPAITMVCDLCVVVLFPVYASEVTA